MWRIYSGAVAMFAGVAAFTVAGRHERSRALESFISSEGTQGHMHVGGWSGTTEDLVHLAGWALIIGGLLLAIAGLIRYSATTRG